MKKKHLGLAAAAALLVPGLVLRGRHGSSHTSSSTVAKAAPHTARTPRRVAAHTHRAVTVGGESLDIGDVMQRTHFAFRPLGDSLVGGDETYAVRVHGQTVEVAPDAPSDSNTQGRAARPLTLQTAAITRGARSLITTATEYKREDDGTVTRTLADDIVETLENTAFGLEQSWRFESKPEATGGMTLDVAVGGEGLVATTETGVHFHDADSGMGVAYGLAHWVDAAGTSTTLAMRYDGNQIHIDVPDSLIESSAYPVVLDPMVGPEYSMDAPIVGHAADLQTAPAIGHPGTPGGEYTVVWADRRRALDMTSDIFMTSVSRSGSVLTQLGTLVSPNDGSDHITPAIQDNIVVYATLSTSGAYEIDATDVSTGAFHQIVPAISYTHCQVPKISAVHDGANTIYAVVWREVPMIGGNGRIWGATFGSDLHPIMPPGALSPDGFDANFPAIAGQATTTNPDFLAVWSDNLVDINQPPGKHNIKAQLLSDTLVLVQSRLVSIGDTFDASHPSVATFGGTSAPYNGFVVAWDIPTSTDFFHRNYDVYAEYVDSLGNGSLPKIISNAEDDQRYPAVAGFGTHYGLFYQVVDSEVLITWQDRSDHINNAIRGQRYTVTFSNPGDLAPNDSVPMNFAGQGDLATGVAASSDTTGGYFVAWTDSGVGQYYDIRGANLSFSHVAFTDPGAPPLPNYWITQSFNKQTAPSIAHCGTNYLVAWRDSRNLELDDYDIYGALLDDSGKVIGSTFPISSSAGYQDLPTVGCNRAKNTFVVAWVDQRNGNPGIYGTMVTPSGTVVFPNGILLAPSGYTENYPSIADDAGGHVWVTYNNATTQEIWGVELDSSGPVGPPRPVVAGQDADIDYDPETRQFFLVWEVPDGNGKGAHDIVGAPMSVAGALGTEFTIDADPADQRYPRVRFDSPGGAALVAYEDDRNIASSSTDIYGTRVSTSGTISGAGALAASSAREFAPRLSVRTGSLEELTFATADGTQFDFDVWGVSLDAGSTSAPFEIAVTPNDREMAPAIACTSESCVVTYRFLDSDPNTREGEIDRVKARVLSY